MTADQESVEYWRSLYLAAQKVIADFETLGVVHPSETLRMKRRIEELEAKCAAYESRSIA